MSTAPSCITYKDRKSSCSPKAKNNNECYEEEAINLQRFFPCTFLPVPE